jgi:serine/threonine protein kinase
VDAQENARQAIGHYDLIQKIADGGMGTVYKGRNQTTGEVVAVKIVSLPPLVRNKDVVLKRFTQEFRAARSLHHPNIVRALDFGSEGDTPYLVMEFVDGETLGERIERAGRLSEDEAVRVVVQVAAALETVHERGLVHRDVKPDNILLTADGQAKLTDLGLVKDLESQSDLTHAGGGLGTPHFMAPEQFRNAKNADRRSDIYSLAATLYMAVTGALPFAGCKAVEACLKKLQDDFPPPRSVSPTLSERVDWVICRAMRADPFLRPASCREFIDDLTDEPVGGNPARSGQADERALLPLRSRAVVSHQATLPTESHLCPRTPVTPSGTLSCPATRKPPVKTGVADPTEGKATGLTWLVILLGLVAGLFAGLRFFPR